MNLPIDAVLPDLLAALKRARRAVLQAPPGAGKTTRVPLAILQAGLAEGRIIMLEPRRVAARAAAERMAETLGEKPGEMVGYRIRGEAAVSKATRIEVVTEGILTRMLQDNPELPGVSAVIFDEFHERSLNADLGLALTWEVAQALRDDLMIIVMSATLDAGPVAAMLGDAPLVSSEGRAFPVETLWLDRPPRSDTRFEVQMIDLVERAMAQSEGGVLVFLPGEGEIRRVAQGLSGRLPSGVHIQPLYGALSLAEQRAAIRPLASGRKLVLATAIAETSLTIQDIRVVIDGGKARRARYDPGSGMTRLVTEPVSRAEADQRRGRAGRVAAGVCYRNWTKGAEGALPLFPPAEIESVDLTGLVLELALWGGADGLAFLTAPPEGALAEARRLLAGLGALDDAGRITDHGRKLSAMPLHPRLAHLLSAGGPKAAEMAALLSERDPLRGAGADLARRLAAIRDGSGDRGTIAHIRAEAKRLRRFAGDGEHPPEALAALAYPDRIAMRRPGDDPRYVLSGGKGARLDAGDRLAGQRLLVVTDLDGDNREAKIRAALPIAEATLRDLFDDQIGWRESCYWSRRERKVIAHRQEQLGAIVLDERIWRDPPAEAVVSAMLTGIRDLGIDALGWSAKSLRLRARIALGGIMDVTDAGLTAALEDWAAPYLEGIRSAEAIGKWNPGPALEAWIGWDGMQKLDKAVPGKWQSPLGRNVEIDYSGEAPEVSLRLQEVFGVTRHPTVGPDRLPLRMVLLSPAGRPVQVTTDLPGFWDGSYADVRKDMRAKYPKHPWPENPREAPPTLRAKPRK